MRDKTNLTPATVRERVKGIAACSGDDEGAHSAEDELHFDVLVAIAKGSPHAKSLAREAIKTAEISFARWCA